MLAQAMLNCPRNIKSSRKITNEVPGAAVAQASHALQEEDKSKAPLLAHKTGRTSHSFIAAVIDLLAYADPAGSLDFSINTNSGTTIAKTNAYMTKVTAKIFASSLYSRCQLARSNVIQAV